MHENDLIRKVRLLSKCMTSQPGWQTVALPILAFLKNKKNSGTSLPGSFFAWLLNKNISLVISY